MFKYGLACVCVAALALGVTAPSPAIEAVGFALENGDVNGDQALDVSDPVYLLTHLYLGGPSPAPLALCGGEMTKVANGDVNGDGTLDISDPVHLLAGLFLGGPAPRGACGEGEGGAKNLNPRVIPPNARPHGKYLGEWSGVWWQWVYDYPAETNPVMDLTGEFAANGQTGSVWLLAGTFGVPAVRTVTVPAGKTLLVPLYNWIWVNIPEMGDNPWSDEQEAYARQLLADAVDPMVQYLTCEVDGVAIQNLQNYRCPTPPDGEYMLTLPENNIWGLPAGTYGPSVDDGVYLMLAPLPAGQHTIHFTAIPPDASFNLDVTYNLTVGK